MSGMAIERLFLRRAGQPPLSGLKARRVLQRAHETNNQRRADAQAAEQIRRDSEMTHVRTSAGPAKRPPNSDAQARELDEWRAELDEAIDLARDAAGRENALGSSRRSGRGA